MKKARITSAGRKLGESKRSKEAREFIARLLALGGRPEADAVVFGPPGTCQLIFTPPRRRARLKCTVGFRSPVGSDELKAQLNRANRKLWDMANDQPSLAYRAISDAAEVLAQLGKLPTNKPVETFFVLRAYDALRNLLGCCKDGPKLSIALDVYEQLQREAANQPPAFFDAVSESPNVRRLKNATLDLAFKLERPPTKRELREKTGWTQAHQKEFISAVRRAGLDWLPPK